MVKSKVKIVDSKFLIIACIMAFSLHSCKVTDKLNVQVYETSESGNSLTKITQFSNEGTPIILTINPDEKFQTITGFGGAFTESSAFYKY